MPESTHIAVIGCSARLPGGVSSLHDLRDLLYNRKSGISTVPADRWDSQVYHNNDITVPGAVNNTKGGFIPNIKGFDAGLFGISPAEAVSMDPQTRLALELAFEAFEHAGYPLQKINGSSSGVYIGACFNDYRDLCYKDIAQGVTSHTITGNTNCCISGRIAYYYGLEGPAITMDTACSSSLVAVHYAIRDLLAGDIDNAIAGGVNIMINPENHMAFTSLNALSPDGTCYSFDARANGYVRSDGGGLLVLKRLADAINDEDNILGIIASSQVNNDGHSKSFTAPNPKAQEKLIKKAIEKSGITPDDIAYIEAHGPGTYVGDPIELNAISGVFDQVERIAPLYVGSIKSNIGHTESASGIASLLKALLTVIEQTIFPNINFEQPNPRFDWEASRIKVPVDVVKANKPICVGVNSFGISGTNVHQILVPPPVVKEHKQQITEYILPFLLPVSAADDETLDSRTEQLLSWLKEGNGHLPERVATIARFHTHLPKRIVITGRNADEVLSQVQSIGSTQESLNLVHATKVFVFSGQGGLWQGMGKELIKSFPVFAAVFNNCASIASDIAAIDLHAALEVIPQDETVRQTLTFSYQLALAELWVSMGVMPDTILGHSLGEIVAACFAGIINRKTALQIVYARGKAINMVAGTGTMWVVGVSKGYYNAHYTHQYTGVEIAAVNGMETIVLSGTETELQQLAVLLDDAGIFNKRTQINYASHSRYIEPALETFKKEMPDYIPATTARCKIFSTSKVAYTEPHKFTKEYWIENLQSTVRFKEAIEALIEENDIAGIEISSHSLLGTLAESITDDKEHLAVWVNSCLKDQSEVQTFSAALSRVYTLGIDINWDNWYEGKGSRKIEVPRYIYNKKEYWIGVQVAAAIHPVAAKNEISKQQYEGLDWNDLLKVLIAEITYLPQAGISIESSFRDIGLDSLMILKLRKRIQTVKGIEVKTTVFWNYPNIRLLSTYLSKHNIASSNDKLQEKIDTLNIADLSDDDINSALDKIIAQTL